MKTYRQYINEGIRDKMTPKSEEEINKSIIKTMNDNDNSGTIYPEASDSDFQHIADLFGEPMENLFVITELDSKWEVINGYLSKLVREDDNYILFDELDGKPIGGEWFCYPERKIAFFKYRPSQHTLNMWAYCKPFTQTLNETIDDINESIRDKMTPKSEEDIENAINQLSPIEKLEKGVINDLIVLVKKALEEGVDIHYRDDWALEVASTFCSEEMVKLLIDNGANAELVKTKLKGMWSNREEMNIRYKRGVKVIQKYETKNSIFTRFKKFIKNESLRDKMTPKSKDEIAQSFVSTLNNIDCPVDECISGSELLKDMADILGEELDNLHVIWEEGGEYNYNSIDKYFSSIIKNMKYVELESDNDNEYICCYPSKKLAQYFYKEDAVMWIYSKPFYCGDINEGIRDKMIPKSKEEIDNLMYDAEKYIADIVSMNDGCVIMKDLRTDTNIIYRHDDSYGKNIIHTIERLYGDYVEVEVYDGKLDEVTDEYDVNYINLLPSIIMKLKRMLEQGIKRGYIKGDINEGIRDKMIPKSDEEVRMAAEDLTSDEKFEAGVRNGVLWMVEEAVDEGTNIHMQNEIGLRNACAFGYMDIVKFLLDKGADIHVEFEFPLRSAAYAENTELVDYLISRGANFEKIYHQYIVTPEDKKIHSFLVKYHTKKMVGESVRDKMTPKSDDDIKMQLMSLSLKDKLEMMSKHDNKKTYKKLLNKYITDDVLKKDAEKESADTKISLGWKYNIPWLLENGIEEGGDISEKGKEIMRFACFNGYYNIVKLLLDKGVSANSKSALSSAVEKGYIDIVKILLEAGADPHQNDNYPITCSSCSYVENSLEIYELLKKYSTQDFSRIDKLISNRRMKG